MKRQREEENSKQLMGLLLYPNFLKFTNWVETENVAFL